ncbi:TraR/DksA C4-type zinc finger protein [Paenibacillus sp. NEAU-GSW1]|uniref:TraR/DksA C4-type zinc finger protein n=1 Tax=Paenibacillus sp. NEAU-GSW1 TaxID=2682486 RepID=UPI0012E20388|nr:TraR/DksA C4-type zinc finger protein [Paenibacillus sp. NEAU-GSW1]MUT66171.1 molecular chaperone DnaK [Paenibacillus sp. NEAU-GSW1]
MTISKERQEQLRLQLETEKQDIENRIRQNDHDGLGSNLRDGTGELSSIDNHPADVGTELFERGKDIALLEQEEMHLSRIDAALQAMNNGTYGQCRICGDDIPEERLEALPDSLYCLQHSPRQNISTDRPVEEALLAPPFGRTNLDEHDSYNGFDGEDAWQIVEQWGNADSPAMSENPDADDYKHIGTEAEENDGFVESLESFLATDITGRHVQVVRNRQYRNYLENGEGDHWLEEEENEPY